LPVNKSKTPDKNFLRFSHAKIIGWGLIDKVKNSEKKTFKNYYWICQWFDDLYNAGEKATIEEKEEEEIQEQKISFSKSLCSYAYLFIFLYIL